MRYQRSADMPELPGSLYWLAEPYPKMVQTLYECEPDPDPAKLFEQTPFAAQASQSPILFSLSPQGDLLQRLRGAPENLPGLLLSCHTGKAQLLQQLRSLLEARFLQGRKALLRYYDPRVASYLLPHCPEALQGRWLGPVAQVAWFGGTWVDTAKQQASWHVLTNEQPTASPQTEPPLVLTDDQLQQLVNQGYERFAWEWQSSRPQYAIEQVVSWVKSGVNAGHNEQDSLEAWLLNQAEMQGVQHA